MTVLAVASSTAQAIPWSTLIPILAFVAFVLAARRGTRSRRRGLTVRFDHDSHDALDGAAPPERLHPSCQRLADRTRLAIAAVLESRVYAENQLEKVAGEKDLRRHQQAIWRNLHEISKLSADHVTLLGDAVGPMTSAAMEPQQRVLAQALRSTEERISAIERYAAQVKAADAALLDWERAEYLTSRNDSYLDLAARTAADEHAIRELEDLTKQASARHEAYRDSLSQAIIAGTLAFPADAGS